MYKSNKKFNELISKMLEKCDKEGYIPSSELAAMLNKDHKAVTRDIREELYRMDMYEIDTSEMFVADWEKDYRNRPRIYYRINSDGVLHLAGRYSRYSYNIRKDMINEHRRLNLVYKKSEKNKFNNMKMNEEKEKLFNVKGENSMQKLIFGGKENKFEEEENLQIGLLLQQIFEMNLLSFGEIEISSVQLSEVTGKTEAEIINQIEAEFSNIKRRANSLMFTDDNYNGGLLAVGIERLKEGLRETTEPDERNRPRKVYYLSGLALTQLISRWDPLIRFMINTIIHNIQDRMQTYGIRSYNLTDFNDDLRELMNRAFELNLAYTSLMNETKYPHIKENYKSIIDKIEELKNEALSLKKKREDRYPKIIQIAEEIRKIDKEHANFMGQLEKENDYEDKEMAKHAIENQ